MLSPAAALIPFLASSSAAEKSPILRSVKAILRYAGAEGRHCYSCTRGSADYAEPLCQCLSGPVVDGLVREQILAAVEPAALEASLAAVAEVERERAERSRHWQLRRERARYEAERAARSTRRASRRIAWWTASWSGGGRRP